ncbi:MAG: signal peptide peptidase SppA [Magnetospiraceae bacterium]
MSLDADTYLYMRRLKRHLTVWRVIGVVAIVVALVILALSGSEEASQGNRIARLTVNGLIVDDPYRDTALREAAMDDAVRALIVRISSPGGTVVGGEALYDQLLAFREKKPVVVVMGEVAASAGYMIALPGHRIFARQSTITGSIGVLMQTTEFTGLMDMLGIKPEAIKSAPLKAVPSPVEPLTDDAREAARAVVLDMYDMFVEMVIAQRGFDRETALALADGRVYTGRQALTAGLIDELGDEQAAIRWLEAEKEIPADLPIFDLEIDYPKETWEKLLESSLGMDLVPDRLQLDGLISLWHPDLGTR